MKIKYFSFFVIVFLLTSCASNNIIGDYLKSDIKANQSGKIIVIKNKIPNRHTFQTLRGLSRKEKHGDMIFTGSKKLSDIEFKYLEQLTLNDSIASTNWAKNDFPGIDLIILSNENTGVRNFIFEEQKKGTGNQYFIYAFSDVIYTKDQKHAVFYISKAEAIGYNVLYSKAILLEKQNNKWTIIDKIESSDLH